MPTKYKGVHVKVVEDHNIAEIVRSPIIDSHFKALSLPDRLVKRRRNKNGGSSSRKEENSSNSTSMLEDLPRQMPSDDCADSATESQSSSSVFMGTAKEKEGRASRASTDEEEEERIEVYISKSTGALTRMDSNVVDMNLADGPLPIFISSSRADEEDTDNGDAVMINKVLQSEFFKVNCSETHPDQGIKNNQHNDNLSEDYFIFNEPAQEGSERQDQIQEREDDQMCVSNHSNDSPAEPLSLNCKTATQSSDGLEVRGMPSEQLTNRDLMEQSEEEVTDVACPEFAPATASEGTPEGTSDIELVEFEVLEDKSQTPHSLPCSPGHVLPDNSLDQTSELCHTAPELDDNDFKPVGVACYDSLPVGCLEVTLECDEQPTPSLISSVQHESKMRRVVRKWKRNSRGRRTAVAGSGRPSYETDSSDIVEPRKAKVRTKQHSGAGVTDEGSSVYSQDEAAVRKSRTTDTRTPRSVDSRTPRAVETKSPRAVDKKTLRTVDRTPPRTVDIRSPKTVDTRSPRTVDTRSPRTVDTWSPRTVDRTPPRTVDTRSPRTVDRTPPKTVDTRSPRTAMKRKAMAEQTPISKRILTQRTSITANKLINDRRDRPVQAEKPESSAPKAPHFVKRKLSECGQTSKTESVSEDSAFKSMSLLINKCQLVNQRKSLPRQTKGAEPASTHNWVSKPVSSKRLEGKSASSVGKSASSEGKSATIGKYDLLKKTISIVKLNLKSKEGNSSDPPIDEESGSVKRLSGAANRKVTTLNDGSSKADPAKVGKWEPVLQIKPTTSSVTDDTSHKVSSEIVDNSDKIVETLGNSACLTVDVISPPLDTACASQSIASSSKLKSRPAYLLPPPEYTSFNHSGDVQFSGIIMKSLAHLAESGFSQIYLLPNNAALPSSDRKEKMVFEADLNSTPFQFIPSSLPNKKSEQGTLAVKVLEPQTVTEIPESLKPLRRLQSYSSLPRKGTDLCSSSFADSGDATHSMNVDRTSSTQQLVPDTREKFIKWTCVDTTAWLEKQGLNRLIPSFSFIDGPSLLELAHYFNEDLDSATGYMHDLGFIFNDQIQLFDALRTIPTQALRQTCLSSVEVPHVGHTDLSSQATETQDMAAPTPRRRGRKPKSGRRHPSKACEGTNSSLAQSGAEVRASTLRIPLSQWTAQNVSSWLTSHGLSRFLPEFADFNGRRLCTLVSLLNTKVGTLYKLLSRMDFTLFESLKFCARLRELSQRGRTEAGQDLSTPLRSRHSNRFLTSGLAIVDRTNDSFKVRVHLPEG